MKKLQLLLIPLLIFISCEEDPEPIDASLSDLYVSEELTYLGGNLSMELNTYNSSDKTIEVDIEIMLINKQEYDSNYSNTDYSSFKDNAGIIIKTLASESVSSGNSIKTTTLTIPLSIDLGDYYILVALLFDEDDNEKNNLVYKLITIKVASLIFSDNFTIYNPDWILHQFFSINNGVAIVSGEDDGFQHNAYININDISNYNKVGAPFEYLVDVDFISMAAPSAYGIGIRDGSTRYYFLLSISGYFEFISYNGGWNSIIDWSADSNITLSGQMRILYQNSKLTLYLDTHMLASIDFQLSSIDRVYLYSQGDQTVEFDNVELYGELIN